MGLHHRHHDQRRAGPDGASAAAGNLRPAARRGRRALKIALGITAGFMAVEAIGGWLANSLALLADAAHMFTDAAALALALAAVHFAARPATARKSFGWMRLEILAALANGVVLALVAAGIFWEAWQRLAAPPQVQIPLMLGIASAGLGANVAAALVLHRAQHGQINTRAAYFHVLGDLLGSLGAIVAAFIMGATGWYAADPIISIFVGLLILASAWKICQQAVDVLLEAVPAELDLEEIELALRAAEGVADVHDLHVWSISSGHHMLTVHVVVGEHGDHHAVLERLQAMLAARFGIEHTTIQIECEDISPREPGLAYCR
ncbi:MAG: zinc transporter ZitB [Planctomycetota bacterium]|nr:MAG: zinc transporter ZitB [Planctomycetota bacterium]